MKSPTGRPDQGSLPPSAPTVRKPVETQPRSPRATQVPRDLADPNSLRTSAARPGRTAPPAARAERKAPPTVLVIDDSDIAREEMRRLLSAAGLQVLTLGSPIGATRAILDGNVDVVVIDVLMPGMRGDRLAALFRSNPRFKSLGVVLVSGENPDELSRLLEETRASAVVQKSDLRQLVSAVQRVLKPRASGAASG